MEMKAYIDVVLLMLYCWSGYLMLNIKIDILSFQYIV